MQILVILSKRETRDYAISSYKLYLSRARCSCLLRGRLGASLGFHPLTALFKSKCDFCKLSSYSQIGRPGTTRSVPTSYIRPVRGVRASYEIILGIGLGFNPLRPVFKFMCDFCKLSSDSQTERPGTTRSVTTSYIGPVRAVRASYGVIWGIVWVFSL